LERRRHLVEGVPKRPHLPDSVARKPTFEVPTCDGGSRGCEAPHRRHDNPEEVHDERGEQSQRSEKAPAGQEQRVMCSGRCGSTASIRERLLGAIELRELTADRVHPSLPSFVGLNVGGSARRDKTVGELDVPVDGGRDTVSTLRLDRIVRDEVLQTRGASG
jgi:hypothetical protein